MNQHERIIQYMKDFGTITTIQAFTDLGITKLTTRISELRRDGYQIRSEKISGKNRYGEKITFNRYSLEVS